MKTKTKNMKIKKDKIKIIEGKDVTTNHIHQVFQKKKL